MRKCANISPYMRRPLVIYYLQLLHSEFPYIWGKFDFLFYHCILKEWGTVCWDGIVTVQVWAYSARIYRLSFRENKPRMRILMTENERFGLVFAKTASINSGIVQNSDRTMSLTLRNDVMYKNYLSFTFFGNYYAKNYFITFHFWQCCMYVMTAVSNRNLPPEFSVWYYK